MFWRKEKSLLPAMNQTTIASLSSLQPVHYTDRHPTSTGAARLVVTT